MTIMREVLIVSRTQMKGSHCIGGFALDNKQPLRLLTGNGDNQPTNSPLKIGQIWNMKFKKLSNIIHPHTEDVHVFNQELVKVQENLKDFILKEFSFLKNAQDLFDGLLECNYSSGRAYIGGRNEGQLPSHSTCFWLSSENLVLEDEDMYVFKTGQFKMKLKYIGLKEKIPQIIPKNTLTRLSLARWWSPQDSTIEEKCYLNISGWY